MTSDPTTERHRKALRLSHHIGHLVNEVEPLDRADINAALLDQQAILAALPDSGERPGLREALAEAFDEHLTEHDGYVSEDEAEFEALPAWVHLCSSRCATEIADSLLATPTRDAQP